MSRKGGPDKITNDGLALQTQLVTKLRKDLGRRFGVFSPVVRAAAASRHATDAFGSRQIYLHSKCLLVDDRYALVGSANANPRSVRIDTELCVAWTDPRGVPALRLRLWDELLGAPAGLAGWAAGDYVANWTAVAAANERAEPGKRQGFVVRHDITRFPGVRDSSLDELAPAFDPTVVDGEQRPPNRSARRARPPR